MKKILILIIIPLMTLSVNSQSIIEEMAIYELNIDSIYNTLGRFLYEQGDSSSIGNGIILYDYSRDSLFFQYDYNLYSEKAERLYRFFTGAAHRYDYFLLTDKEKGYIINMRNPLDSILNKLNSISTFTTEFLNHCTSEIKKIHYANWENYYDIKPTYMDEDGNYWEIEYDPNKW